ncbi:hypothetical protein JCM11491_006992 [Sporobolomyces phaffii]
MTSVSSYGARARLPNPLAADPEWVHRRFERAVDIIQSLPKGGPIQTNYDDKLLLYAVYKQATEGNIKSVRPGMFDVLGRAKWDAWNKRKGLSAMEAERLYVETLIRILRGYSDRTQAVELTRELENFTLERTPRRTVAGGSKLASSRGGGGTNPTRSTSSRSSSSSSSRSTASYDEQRPRYASSSRRSRSNVTPQATPRDPHPARGGGGSNSVPPPPPANLVAPSLPGYGPPRTRTDSVKQPRRSAPPRDERAFSEDSFSTTDGEDDGATGPYASVPPTAPSSVAPLRPAGPPSISATRPPRLPPTSVASLRGNNSPAPSVYSLRPRSTHQQVAYPANYVAAPPPPSLAPLTSSNLLLQRTGTLPVAAQASPSSAAASPAAALDAALDRIQTSLTALHERLSILESSPDDGHGHGGAAASSDRRTLFSLRSAAAASVSTLVRLTVVQLLVLLRLRSPAPTTSSSSSHGPRGGRDGVRSLVGKLLPNLAWAVVNRAKQVAGDAVVAFAIVALLARIRGVDVVGWCGAWLTKYLVARQARRAIAPSSSST